MSDPKLAVRQKLDAFASMLSRHDPGVIDFLWGDGRFVLVGSEVGEIFRTRADLASHLGHLLENPATSSSFPIRASTWWGRWRGCSPKAR